MTYPVVILPGYYGSILSDTISGRVAWLDGYTAIHTDETLESIRLDTGDPDRIVATGILDELFIAPYVTPAVYKVLIDFLRFDCKYPDDWIYRFGIDWRKSIHVSAQNLAKRIEGHLAKTGKDKVVLIAHSHGGLVARAYLSEFGPDKVAHLITLGTPHKGMLKTLDAVMNGITFMLFPKRHLKEVARTFPSAFELLPQDAGDELFNYGGVKASPFTKSGWCPPECTSLLTDAAAAIAKIRQKPPVPCTFVYGTRLTTPTIANANGKVNVDDTDDGDSTVPRISAMGNGIAGEIERCAVPFAVHSMIFGNPFVQSIVKDVVLDRNPEARFAWGFLQSQLLKPRRDNMLAIELRDRGGDPVPNADVKITLDVIGVRDLHLPQDPAGDYVYQFKNPPAGRHLQFRIEATAPTLKNTYTASGILFSGNY